MINRPDTLYRYLFLALLAAMALLLIAWAAFMPATSGYEADIMEAASVMVNDGGWGLPRLESGQTVYHTPILPYWLAAAGHLLIPGSFLGYRLLQLVLALLALWGYFTGIKNYLDARTAFYSCCILISSLFFCWQLFLSTPDSLAALSIAAAVFAFYFYLKSNNPRYFWLLYGSIAVGILSKGLLPLLIVLLIMVVHLMFRIKMNSASFEKIRFYRGMGLVLLLVLPWYGYAGFISGGSWLIHFLQDFHLHRYFGESGEVEGAFYLPFAFIILGLLPFGVFLFRALPYGWRYRVRKDLLLLSLLSLIIILLFFGFSNTFYPHYILFALPFGALLIGYRLGQAAGRPLMKMNVSLGIVLLGILAVVVPLYLYAALSTMPEGSLQNVLFGILLALPPLGTISCLLLWSRKETDIGIMVLSLGYLFFNALLVYFMQQYGVLSFLPQQFLF